MAFEVTPELFGWIPEEERDKDLEQAFETGVTQSNAFGSVAQSLAGTGQGKDVLLYKALEKVNGGEYPLNVQTIGDCVSHGWAKAIEVRRALQVLAPDSNEEWPGLLIATEWLYGAARVLQGGGRLRGDGAFGHWASAAVKEHGTLLRKKYGNHDLSKYDGSRARTFGSKRGLPRELEEYADENPVLETVLVEGYEQARDLIANGYPIAVCSSQGFSNRRDADGFARPKGTWHHCMMFQASFDSGRRPGLNCQNSWPRNWISGPRPLGIPEGSFNVDAEVVDRMCQGRDTYAIADVRGFEKSNVDFVFDW